MTAKLSGTSRDRHFARRLKAAKAGQHLPAEIELLRGMPFLSENISADIREFGERLSRRLKRKPRLELAALVESLDDLAVDQGQEALGCVDTALEAAAAFNETVAHAARLRVKFYLACLGNPDAASIIATEIASIALMDVRHDEFELVPNALAWAVVAKNLGQVRRDGWSSPRDRVSRDLHHYAEEFAVAMRVQEEKPKQPEDKTASTDKADEEENVAWEQAGQASASGTTAVVFSAIGNETTSEGKRVVQEFKELMNVPLPLPVAPDLPGVRSRLAREFPHAVAVIDALLSRLVGRKHIHLRPTVLVGPPGCGKTRFSRRLCEELTLPFELVSCGGLSDSALGGTARRWSSGEPSIAILSIRRHHSAGPAIILDEVEKVGTGRRNGNVHDILIGLLEKETSSRWFDPYVESACDLSHVSWLMTANTTADIPSVLLDRCHMIDFPEPGPEQLHALAPRILEQLYLEARTDRRWVVPLEPFELGMLASHWQGGSVRRLQQLLEVLIRARERHMQRH